MITLPLDLTLNGSPVRVTRIGTDAVVYHLLKDEDGTLVRDGGDIPVAGYTLTDDTTAEDIAAHLANPPATPAPVPTSVPLWAFRQVLLEDNLLAAIQTAVSANTLAANFLEYGNFVDRSSPLLAEIATGLGKTDAEVDGLFRRAAAIRL